MTKSWCAQNKVRVSLLSDQALAAGSRCFKLGKGLGILRAHPVRDCMNTDVREQINLACVFLLQRRAIRMSVDSLNRHIPVLPQLNDLHGIYLC